MAVHPGTAEMLGTVADGPAACAAEDMSKKVRKPYTITKSRESWTDQEHDKFLEALQLFDRDWKKIEAFVGSKTVIQIRSHAQKYFLKVQKNGTGEHVPPPRPKRKSAQPYPQKASKSALAIQQVPTSASQAEPAYTVAIQPCAVVSSASAMPAWVHHMAPPGSVGFVKKGVTAMGIGPMSIVPPKDQIGNNGESSTSILPHQLVPGTMSQGNGEIVLRAMPDFTEVYSFLGSVLDPTTNGHLERMREMAPIDRETVLLLMKNLSINLSSADFEEHKLFLSVYDMDPEDTVPGVENDIKCQTDTPVAVAQPPLDSGDGTLVSGHSELPPLSDSREVTGESKAEEGNLLLQSYPDEMPELPLQCHPDGGELRSSAAGVPRPLQCLQLRGTPLLLEQCALGTPAMVNFPLGSQDHGFGPQDSYGEAEESDDGKGEAAVVDMWWS